MGSISEQGAQLDEATHVVLARIARLIRPSFSTKGTAYFAIRQPSFCFIESATSRLKESYKKCNYRI
jgi:hypothetical protein